MHFSLFSTVLALAPGILAKESTSTEFLASNPDLAVGRAAFDEARLNVHDGDALTGNTFMSVSRPAQSVIMVQEFNATTKELVYEVALVNDSRAEEWYDTYMKEEDVSEPSKKKCPRAQPRAIFERASRCGQFCGRSPDCTVQERCPLCAHGTGRCRWQLTCQPRGNFF